MRVDPPELWGPVAEAIAFAVARRDGAAPVVSSPAERAAYKRATWIAAAQAAIYAYEAALADQGMVIVPREPTEAMRRAGGEAHYPMSVDFADECWRVMVEDAPK